jgi:hypothetical protein
VLGGQVTGFCTRFNGFLVRAFSPEFPARVRLSTDPATLDRLRLSGS